MAETQADKPQTLAEQYSLEKQEKPDAVTKPNDVKVVEDVPTSETVSMKAGEASDEVKVVEDVPTSETVPMKADEAPAAVEESPVVTPASETNAATEDSSDSSENSGDQEADEETPEIKIETAPADFRFPTTNQTRHCFTRYVEYHRCIAAKGEEAPECDKFKKYYRSLCPGEWVERWNEQRENGTFPGPL